ncbi:organic cation transporter protein [Parasteatoda tepidariorum]|uniref:organic cation transporter protein n=1 Tax=Parasteatoda tepidariorum TaxID=114398 RepID=UPI001C71B639|nr:organic cation transporter protein [Parasteatoda tepidariorum]
MDFEDILLDVGDYGKYQQGLIKYFLIPAASLLPWFTMNILFMVSVPDHWCNVPELVSSNLSISDQRSLISPPGDKCHMYNINFTDFLSNGSYIIPENTTTRPCNHGWQYDNTYWDTTASTKWNMVCDDGHYNSLVLTLFNVGSILGTPIYGMLSDKIGRKITFFITIFVTAVTAITSVVMDNFIAFIVIKTINGSLMPSVFQLPYIIVLELVSPEMRTRMNGLVNCSWTVGLCFLPLLAYYSRSWVILGLVTSSVTLIYGLYWKFLPESPRWLVSQERYEEATDIMMQIAKKNGKQQDESVLSQKLKTIGEKLKKEKTVDGVQNSSLDLLRYPQLRKKFLIITTCWMANIMAYYGLQINVSNLAGNEFINFFLLSLVEVPGYMVSWVFMEKFGRRWCSVVGFLLSGVACMLPSIDLPYMDVVCSMIGKFFAAGTFMATYQQSSELYPTVIRSLGMGMSSTIAMVATLIVPYLVYLSVYGKAIPFVIIGLSCILSGLLASLLPETLNENLPQSIFEAEEFGRSQKFFSWNRRRRSVSKERRASFGLKTKGFDTICGMEEHDSKQQRSSQIFTNIEMVPGIENTLMVSDSIKGLNGSTKNNSIPNETESRLNAINNFTSNDLGNVIAPIPKSPNNLNPLNDKLKNSAIVSETETENDEVQAGFRTDASNLKEDREKFSYVNEVFETNDKTENVNKLDAKTDESPSNLHHRELKSGKINDSNSKENFSDEG